MRIFPLDRTHLAQAAVVSALTLAALALLAAVLARWTWAWLAPATEPQATSVATSSGHAAAADLFGRAAALAESGSPLTVATGIRLLGVVAAAGAATGYAVVQLDGQPIAAVREGADIAPGVVLVEVDPRHVVIERGGQRETLPLPTAAAPAPASSR